MEWHHRIWRAANTELQTAWGRPPLPLWRALGARGQIGCLPRLPGGRSGHPLRSAFDVAAMQSLAGGRTGSWGRHEKGRPSRRLENPSVRAIGCDCWQDQGGTPRRLPSTASLWKRDGEGPLSTDYVSLPQLLDDDHHLDEETAIDANDRSRSRLRAGHATATARKGMRCPPAVPAEMMSTTSRLVLASRAASPVSWRPRAPMPREALSREDSVVQAVHRQVELPSLHVQVELASAEQVRGRTAFGMHNGTGDMAQTCPSQGGCLARSWRPPSGRRAFRAGTFEAVEANRTQTETALRSIETNLPSVGGDRAFHQVCMAFERAAAAREENDIDVAHALRSMCWAPHAAFGAGFGGARRGDLLGTHRGLAAERSPPVSWRAPGATVEGGHDTPT